jgi:hypothetical protein
MGVNAQTSVPKFTAGEILTAANQNISAGTGVPVFATSATRDAAFGGTGEKVLAEGQTCYLESAPDQLQVYDGSAWIPVFLKYTTWSPTYTNLSLGNGAATSDYVQIGKFVHFFGQIIFGSTTAVTGTIQVSFPVTASASIPATTIGNARLFDGGTVYDSSVILNSTTRFEFQAMQSAGLYTVQQPVNATTPFTWGNGDLLFYSGYYAAA